MGMKHLDIFGAFGCSDCHSQVDSYRGITHNGRVVMLADEVKQDFYEGIFRTQEQWVREGLLIWKGMDMGLVENWRNLEWVKRLKL